MHHGQEDEEAIVQEMCTSLLERLLVASRDFERHWTTTVAEALERNQQSPSDPHRACLGLQQLQLGQQSEKGEAAGELAAVIEETIGVFERSVSLALLHTEPGTPNRDATAIFDCRRVVGRVVEREGGGGVGEEKVVQALRRLTRLARTLGGRLTSPYHVANSSVLAAAVCEMGFQLEERLAGSEGRRLRKALEAMNERVVEGMRELLVSTRRTVLPTTVLTPNRSSSVPVRKAVPPGRATVSGKKSTGGYGSRSPGFLMSTELRVARSKLPQVPVAESRYRMKSRERREGDGGEKGGGGGMNRFVIKPDPHCRRGREVAALEQKWGRMLEGEAAFLRSALREERSRQGAERLARDITKEVLGELEARRRKFARAARKMGKNDYNRYYYENQKNNAARYGYAPAPSAPTLEININQNNPSSSVSPANGNRRAPSVPPPPPPCGGDYAQVPSTPPKSPERPPPPKLKKKHIQLEDRRQHEPSAPKSSLLRLRIPLPSYNPMWFDRFPRRENRGMFRLCLVEFMLGLVIFAGGVWCLRDTADYCPFHSAIWTSSVYLINAIVGSVAAKSGNPNMYLAHLVLSLISCMMCAVSGILSARNWTLVGTYHHPQVSRDEAFCLMGEHDPSRISYIFSHMDRYDFSKCLWQLKVGVAVNSIQFVIAALEIFLNFLSAILCLKRTCGNL